MVLVASGAVPVTNLLPSIRRAVSALDSQLPLAGARTMEDVIGQTLATSRFQSTLLALLGGTGLILAIVGIYGVIAVLVVQRTPEFGIRIALGASRGRVLGMVVSRGIAVASIGIGIGLVASLLGMRVLEHLLFGVSTHDPATFIGVAVLLLLVSAVASVVPASRATRVDPLAAIRS
jgi:ABC-type antimicrobial peptide transport system permease subunit